MTPDPHAILVVDLAYGDCGKGTVVDFLTRRSDAHTVVRFNGGPQAAHNVVTPDGRHHTFAQFGSGTFVPGVRTLLSRFMLIEPYALLNEADHLARLGVTDALDRLTIDERCPVITPAHQAANRLRELARGDGAHGTCGMGVGETMADLIDHPGLMLHARNLADRPTVVRLLRAICDLKVEQLRDVIAAVRTHPKARFGLDTLLDPSWIDAAADNYAHLAARAGVADESAVATILRAPGTLIFEGAQGVLLDEWFGFHPHTTWSTTTFANADALLDEAAPGARRTRVGVLRTYFTRHGAGPLVTEGAGLRPAVPEPHNADAGWQGRFRVGAFDAVAARYALAVTGPVDMLAVTHLDRLRHLPPRVCSAYRSTRSPDATVGGPARDNLMNGADRIADIPVRRPADLVYQERLTGLLRSCRPEYTRLPDTSADGFLSVVSRELNTPVGITSTGPTADDKQIITPGRLKWAAGGPTCGRPIQGMTPRGGIRSGPLSPVLGGEG